MTIIQKELEGNETKDKSKIDERMNSNNSNEIVVSSQPSGIQSINELKLNNNQINGISSLSHVTQITRICHLNSLTNLKEHNVFEIENFPSNQQQISKTISTVLVPARRPCPPMPTMFACSV